MAPSHRPQPFTPRNVLVFDRPSESSPPPMGTPATRLAPADFHDVADLLRTHVRDLCDVLHLAPGETFTLSARQAYVALRGELFAYYPWFVDCERGTFEFNKQLPGLADVDRVIGIRPHNLVPGRSYVVQLRVGEGDGGNFVYRWPPARRAGMACIDVQALRRRAGPPPIGRPCASGCR